MVKYSFCSLILLVSSLNCQSFLLAHWVSSLNCLPVWLQYSTTLSLVSGDVIFNLWYVVTVVRHMVLDASSSASAFEVAQWSPTFLALGTSSIGHFPLARGAGMLSGWFKHIYCALSVCVCAQSLSHVQLCNPVDCSLLGSTVYVIFQARILEWDAISYSQGSSWPRDQTRISCIDTQTLYTTLPPFISIITLWCIMK